MQRWNNILFNITLSLNCLLLFLLVFESRLSVPTWLQVVGRTHPLVLHFPVVLLMMYALLVLFVLPKKLAPHESFEQIATLLLLFAALGSAITALAGLFLSKEDGYDASALQWHKWSGVAVSVFTLAWYYFRTTLQTKRIASFSMAIIGLVLITFAGHQGADITHGKDFLLAPVLPEKKQVVASADEADVFKHMVQPILQAKCISCHNSDKAKGELMMETEALLLKGGKSGLLWDTTATDLGLLLRRVHLPAEDKKHMPPIGKPQLTDEEVAIITQWIRKGAAFALPVASLQPNDTLRQIANKLFKANESTTYDFAAADASTIEKLNSINRVVTPIALESPAIDVSFFNSNLFKPEQLKDLLKIKKQIVSLDLSKMPVKDEDIKTISQFENLERLLLNFTHISGAALPEIKKLKQLKQLSLSGTQIKATQLQALSGFQNLKTVEIWNMPLSANDIEGMKRQMKHIHFVEGFKGDTIVLKLSPPVVLNEKSIITTPIPLQLKHYINGSTIRFTMDGSEPDSIHSPVYKPGQLISGTVVVKAKAYKPGWISSDVIQTAFYKSTYKPDSVTLLLPPDPSHTGKGSQLTDLAKSEANFRSGVWLAWRATKMETLLSFQKPTPVQSITLSCLLDVNSYIMPAASVEIWGGNDAKKMQLLSRLVPVQPTEMSRPSLLSLECKFAPSTVQYIKIVANPVGKLPAWHPGKGDKAWLFIDEVLVN